MGTYNALHLSSEICISLSLPKGDFKVLKHFSNYEWRLKGVPPSWLNY